MSGSNNQVSSIILLILIAVVIWFLFFSNEGFEDSSMPMMGQYEEIPMNSVEEVVEEEVVEEEGGEQEVVEEEVVEEEVVEEEEVEEPSASMIPSFNYDTYEPQQVIQSQQPMAQLQQPMIQSQPPSILDNVAPVPASQMAPVKLTYDPNAFVTPRQPKMSMPAPISEDSVTIRLPEIDSGSGATFAPSDEWGSYSGVTLNDAFNPPLPPGTNTDLVDFKKGNVDSYNAKDFLPKDINDEWFETDFSLAKYQLNDDKLINTDRYIIGINTVGQSLKNPSYDIRGTIPNPKFTVSPWMQSTYEPDFNLKPLC
jgi:hypothetical protein